MGVIDVLPNCVSSVYLMWKKDWERFSLGKVCVYQWDEMLDISDKQMHGT